MFLQGMINCEGYSRFYVIHLLIIKPIQKINSIKQKYYRFLAAASNVTDQLEFSQKTAKEDVLGVMQIWVLAWETPITASSDSSAFLVGR